MKDLALESTPAEIQFGVVQLGIQSCVSATLKNNERSEITVEEIHSFERGVTATIEGNRTLKWKERIGLRVCFTPIELGAGRGTIMVKTNWGVVGLELTAEVEENHFNLWPIALGSGDQAAVTLHNPFPHTLTILALSATQDSLQIQPSFLLFVPSNHNHTICTISVAANATDPWQSLHILTSQGAVALPVFLILSHNPLSLFPEELDFSVVTLQDMSHSAQMDVSSFLPFTDLQGVSDSDLVNVTLTKLPFCGYYNIYAVFSPTEDGVYSGNITLVVDHSRLFVVPYRGVALFGLVRYNQQELIFRPDVMATQEIWLGMNFPIAVRLITFSTFQRIFAISPVRVVSKVTEGDKGVLIAVKFNCSAPRIDPDFLGLESDLGYTALPLIVDNGSFTCQINEEDCKVVTKLDFGSVQFGEIRQVAVNITNTGFFPLHVSISTGEMHRFVSAFALLAEKRENLTDSTGNPIRFQALEPSSSLLIELHLVFTDESPQSLVPIRISHHTRELLFTWSPNSGDLVLYPKEIHLENVYMGHTQTVSILLQHSFHSVLHIHKVTSNVDLISFTQHQDYIVSNAPIHVRDVTYPVLRPGTVPLLLVQDYSKPVSPVEVKLWLSALLLCHQKVKGKVTFSFDGVMDAVIPFSASFSPPKLTVKEVDFGFAQLSFQYSKYIRIHNPSDAGIRLQLLLYSGPLTTDPNITALVTAETAGLAVPQQFYLAESARAPLDLPAHGTVMLGPVLCRLQDSGLAKSTLYLRNNLTGFESVPLSGKSAYGELTVVKEMDRDSDLPPRMIYSKRIPFDLTRDVPSLERGERLYGFTKSFLLRNTGNKPLFILNTVLEGGLCALHGVYLLSCHEVMYVRPGWLLEVTISVKPTFISAVSSLDLVLVTEEEHMKVSIDIISPATACRDAALARHALVLIWMLNVLLTVSFGSLLTFFHEELKDKGLEMYPVAAKPTCEFPLTLRPLASPLPKRHKRKATSTPIQAPTFTQAVAIPLEPLEEETVEMNDEDFLDDYKAKSGLFWGFQPSAED